MGRLILVLFWATLVLANKQRPSGLRPDIEKKEERCYASEDGTPQRCVPDFVNVAFGREFYVTNTCGEREHETFCHQTRNDRNKLKCDICDSRVVGHNHPSEYLTDFNNPGRETWWQSSTMEQGMQYPNSVNLTIRLGKSFHITYVKITFVSPRPESMVIYKKTHRESEWQAWQYYSGSCRTTFNLLDQAPILPGNEAVAQCTREFSDISPLTNATIAFSTLEGRPSAEAFEESEVLQEWITATEIQISLVRMNTFGDETFKDTSVLKSYYYAISDIAIGGRCTCNGHAGECPSSSGRGLEQFVCNCKHNTAGTNCEKCADFYNDRPWRAATVTDANECVACDCNGLTKQCFFDEVLYEKTGHGGHCIGCSGNTQGPNCGDCLPNHYRRPGEKICTPCQCNEKGSASLQCDKNGRCPCKPGVGGKTCDACLLGFYDFGVGGCKDCGCNTAGSSHNIARCDIYGTCSCKKYVEGQKCNLCNSGYFNLAEENYYGCSPCFCFGHTSTCISAPGFYKQTLQSDFSKDIEDWTAVSNFGSETVQFDELEHAIAVTQRGDSPVYFHLPKKYLGDLRFGYNQFFSFTIRSSFDRHFDVNSSDVIIFGNGKNHTFNIKSCKEFHYRPSSETQTVHFYLHPDQCSSGSDNADFLPILSNVTEFWIRATYSRGDRGYLYNFTLETATNDSLLSETKKPANWVERCSCGNQYAGDFCEFCAPGYKRAIPFSGSLGECIPCECNGHSSTCDIESGVCSSCKHNTDGPTCSICARGYYGDAIRDGENACKKCECPENGPCLEENGNVYCTECPEGHTGELCEYCTEDYYGDPINGLKCKRCECNGNVDSNDIGNCDAMTGVCKKCLHKTTGDHCELCQAGFWGNAMSEEKPPCRPCNCYRPGTTSDIKNSKYLECSKEDGQCECLPNVEGLQCQKCKTGYFNITSGIGCQECACDPIGSLDFNCDLLTGICSCKLGVTGSKCDQCKPHHYGFSAEGCIPCDCDKFGSETFECDVNNGQCLCKDNVEGRRCDQCSENYHNLRDGCFACNDCYGLVQKRKNSINESITDLHTNLTFILNNPTEIDDKQFEAEVSNLKVKLDELKNRADSIHNATFEDLTHYLNETSTVRKSLQDYLASSEKQTILFENEREPVERNLAQLENKLEKARQMLDSFPLDTLTPKNSQLNSLAQEAQVLVDSILQNYNQIKAFSDEHATILKNAYSEAREAVFGSEKYDKKVTKLENDLKDLEKQFERINNLAELYINESILIYGKAAQHVKEAEKYDIFSLKYVDKNNQVEFADFIEDKLSKLRNKIEKFEAQKKDYTDKLEETKSKISPIVKLYEKAKNWMRAKIEKVEAYKQRAKDAKQNAEHVFQQANDLLEVVEMLVDDPDNFQSTFNSKIEKMEELKTNLTGIDDQLDGLVREMSQIESSNVISRSSKLKQTADKYKKNLEEFNIIRDEIRQTQPDAIKDITDDLTEQENVFDTLQSNIEEKLQTSKLEMLKSSQTKQSADLLSKQLDIAAKVLKDLQTRLESFDSVTDEELADLEDKIREQEESIEKAINEHDIEQYKSTLQKMDQTKSSLKREIHELQVDQMQLEAILDNIPSKCFNNPGIEKE